VELQCGFVKVLVKYNESNNENRAFAGSVQSFRRCVATQCKRSATARRVPGAGTATGVSVAKSRSSNHSKPGLQT
jgi:hypothetical protein